MIKEIDKDKRSSFYPFPIMECDICGSRFTAGASYNWPLCCAGIPHDKMTSDKQKEIREALCETCLCFKRQDINTDIIEKDIQLCPYPDRACVSFNLPDIETSLQTVSVIKDKYIEFRNKFVVMGEFIGNILGKKNWSTRDLKIYSDMVFNDKKGDL
jgi:hypothetical protein